MGTERQREIRRRRHRREQSLKLAAKTAKENKGKETK